MGIVIGVVISYQLNEIRKEFQKVRGLYEKNN